MNDHDLDELASAYLDGEASAQEVARVESDPALLARVAALGEVRTALRRLPVRSSAAAAPAVAAALAAFEEEAEAETGAPAREPLSSPTARWRWSPRTLRLVGAAAVALLLAAAVPLLGRLGDGQDDDREAARFEETGAAIGDDGAAGDRSGGVDATAEDAAPSSTAAAGAWGLDGAARDLGHLGSFASVDELLDALVAPAEQSAAVPDTLSTDGGSCPPAGAAGSIGSAVVDGTPVLVVVEPADDPDGGRVATVYRQSDCEPLGARPLP